MTDDLERSGDAAAGEPVAGPDAVPVEATSQEATTAADARPVEAVPASLAVPAPTDVGNASLLALIDRLGGLLERSDLSELEVEAGATSLILRKPIAVAASPAGGAIAPDAANPGTASPSADAATATALPPARPSVRAPLTGIWYGSPAPGSAPFVEVGREIAVGQVVGLIEAMKLFNEIKSDLAGRVVRVVPESGTLVKAKQPLIEVEPL
jgi:acetyl-CoA carboxylase biotin carboxyl carrier protein